MRFMIYLGLFLSMGCLATAENITNTMGKVYSDLEIRRVEPDAIVVMGKSGIWRIPFTELSADLQKRFNYDPVTAKEYGQKRNAAQQAAYQRTAAARQRARERNEIESSADTSAFPLTVSQMKITEGSVNELVTETQGAADVTTSAMRRQNTKTYTMEAVVGNGTADKKEFQAIYGGRSLNEVVSAMKSVRIKVTATERSSLVIRCDGKEKSFL